MPSASSRAMCRLPRIYWGVRRAPPSEPNVSASIALRRRVCNVSQPSPTAPTTQRTRRTFLPSSSACLYYALRKFRRDSDDPGKKPTMALQSEQRHSQCRYAANRHEMGTQSDGEPFSLEGVSQTVYILPERLPALVRPAFDLVLRRIRSLKRCVQA